ncbi:hypothetical protein Celaphus_00014230, partial [Cervus elaphus hippelaphus]
PPWPLRARAPRSSPSRSGTPNLPGTPGATPPPPQFPAGIWGSGLGGAEGGAPASRAGLPSGPGPGCRVTRSPAEPRGARASGLLTLHPRVPSGRGGASSPAWGPHPRLPGPQNRPRPRGCARPARTRFVWFSSRGLFLEFLPFPLFLDLRGPPSRPGFPGAPTGGVSTPRARRVSPAPAPRSPSAVPEGVKTTL